jgi:hypothetical protein
MTRDERGDRERNRQTDRQRESERERERKERCVQDAIIGPIGDVDISAGVCLDISRSIERG